MKWLLLTTSTRTSDSLDSNIGDEFARLGVEKAVRAADPKADIVLIDKEDPVAWEKPVTFDRALIAGMPLFWSTEEQTCPEIWWWDKLWHGWLTAEPGKLATIGVGHVVLGEPCNPKFYFHGIHDAHSHSRFITTREPIALALTTFVESVCPSTWLLSGLNGTSRMLKLCNLMPKGGHFGHLRPGVDWDAIVSAVSRTLLSQGFEFVAHVSTEAEYARQLGWPDQRIHLFGSCQQYLALYSEAALYVGNRVHGALVTASTGYPSLVFTHDSRVGAVDRVGGSVLTIDDDLPDTLALWLSKPSRCVPQDGFDLTMQFSNTVKLLQALMS